MAEPLAMSEPPTNVSTIQCSLCLHDIEYVPDDSKSGTTWVFCPRCEYRQPTSKMPRLKDLGIFGAVVGTIYIATIVAVFLMR